MDKIRIRKLIGSLAKRDYRRMYMNDFFLTWEKSDDEIAAKVMGIDTFRTKVLSFCLGAFFAGVGGALLGNLLTTIDPKMFTFLLTFNVLMIVVAGGLGSLTGSILGSAVITVLLEWLRAVEDPIRNPRHPRHAHGRVLAGPSVHHPVPPRGHHGNA